MFGMGLHSEATEAGAPLVRAHRAAWAVFLTMAGTTMTFQVYHAVTAGQMRWELAWLYGIVPLSIAVGVLEFASKWRNSAGQWGAYLVTAGAMYLSAAATGTVTAHAAPPHAELLFGVLLDGAALLAIRFILSGPKAADAVAAATAREAALRAQAEALRAELDTARAAHDADRRTLAAVQEEAALRPVVQAERDEARTALDTLQAELATAEAARTAAERQAAQAEAKTARLDRKLGGNGTRNAGAGDRKPSVPNDVDARAEALRIHAEKPDITGRELGELCGKSERWGQLRKQEFGRHVTQGN
jgi:hypothetical protein